MTNPTDDDQIRAPGAIDAETEDYNEVIEILFALNGKYGSWAVEQVLDACEEICRRAALDPELPWNQASAPRARFGVVQGGDPRNNA